MSIIKNKVYIYLTTQLLIAPINIFLLIWFVPVFTLFQLTSLFYVFKIKRITPTLKESLLLLCLQLFLYFLWFLGVELYLKEHQFPLLQAILFQVLIYFFALALSLLFIHKDSEMT